MYKKGPRKWGLFYFVPGKDDTFFCSKVFVSFDLQSRTPRY